LERFFSEIIWQIQILFLSLYRKLKKETMKKLTKSERDLMNKINGLHLWFSKREHAKGCYLLCFASEGEEQEFGRFYIVDEKNQVVHRNVDLELTHSNLLSNFYPSR
jgi:hypothetical protein